MNLEIFISTIDNDISSMDSYIFSLPNVTIINQKTKSENGDYKKKYINGVTWIDYNAIGLSKSRNLALKESKSDYVYLTDDDVILTENFNQNIMEIIKKNSSSDVYAFQVKGIGGEFKDYNNKKEKLNFLTSLKLSSVELIYRTEFIKKNNLFFDEAFGAGSIYKMGEENIFIYDILKAKGTITYIPEVIASVQMGNSSWFSGFNKKYFFDRGAIYRRMFGPLSQFFSFLFCISKKELFIDEITLKEAFKYTNNGKKDLDTRFSNR